MRSTGCQIGVINLSDDATGCQIGVFNATENMRGLQIGFLNMISASSLPIMVFANASF